MQYFGGKQKISKHIAKVINSLNMSGFSYSEPFCGSCNVASKVNIKNKILNDKNPYLIAMFQALQDGWKPPIHVSEEEYIYIKNNQDESPPLSGFVGFACSFAGKYFGGYARDYRCENNGDFALRGYNNIMKKMETLKDSTFSCSDFRDLSYDNSIVYCDPPYKNTTPYCKNILGEFPYDDFLNWVVKQSKNNIVLVSEYKHNVPDGADIILEIPSKTGIRDKDNNSIRTIEVVYTYNKKEIELWKRF